MMELFKAVRAISPARLDPTRTAIRSASIKRQAKKLAECNRLHVASAASSEVDESEVAFTLLDKGGDRSWAIDSTTDCCLRASKKNIQVLSMGT